MSAATALGRVNPTVKLAVLVVGSLALLFLWDPRTLFAIYAVTVVGVVVARAVPLRTLVLGQLPFLAFGVSLVLVNAFSRPGTVVAELPVRVTVEGLSAGVALALRALVVGVCSIAFIATTPPRDLMVSLVQHARLSPRYAYPLLAGHRLLLGVPQQWASIRAAHAVRGPKRRDGRPRFGTLEFARCAFALLVGMVRTSERVALALETRGLGSGPRTIWRPVELRGSDLAFAVGVLGSFGLLVGVGSVVLR